MKKLSAAQIREMFLRFFQEKGHKVEPSASLIPQDDPSLLWINSGVATLKKYFDGRLVPDNPRITNCQKSIRTNDIENVGKTARHHTFFEMLGNFSIGDYFKREAIHWAWEFLTSPQWIGFDPDRLSVTIHPEDEEAYKIWHEEIGLPDERIIRLEDNFWDIGEGPCGPNTEIFYDRGEAYGSDPDDPELYPGGENERYLEIWNLVFSQYNHNPDGSYTPLPRKNIDTGMGLERMASILQDVPTNFDTDLFQPIIQKTAQMAGKAYGVNANDDVAFKVIADHIRAITFAIGDGALPSNEGRGYVIRRLLRRAVRYGKVLGINEPFLYRLTPVVGEVMGSFYPEVVEKAQLIADVVRTEEERFHETLSEGLAILAEMVAKLKKEGKSVLAGKEAFTLYDTYGFPLDLTEDYAAEHGLSVDKEGFEREMENQRERARKARQNVDSMQVQEGPLAEFKEPSQFVGYDTFETEAKVLAILVDGQFVDMAGAGQTCYVILDQTPFYAESGGQVADQGVLEGEGLKVRIDEVQKAPNGQHLHRGVILEGTLSKGKRVKAKIDGQLRAHIIKNHTATHLLHQALKDVLGDHVNQAGSLVAPDRLRFDFTHFSGLTAEQIAEVERRVNEIIWKQVPVEIFYRSLEEAKAMGAMALFGEKYGEIVRVVKVGPYSMELCGGCHVANSAEIGLFKIISEGGIGAGTRRIEAVTGQFAYEHLSRFEGLLEKAAQLVKSKMEEVPGRIEGLFKQLKELERENESLRSRLARLEAARLEEQVEKVDDFSVLAVKVEAKDMDDLRQRLDTLKQRLGSAIIVLGAEGENKAMLVAGVTQDLVKRGFHAGELVKQVAKVCEGGGGGRPDLAQAGGKRPEKLNEALRLVPDLVKSVLQS